MQPWMSVVEGAIREHLVDCPHTFDQTRSCGKEAAPWRCPSKKDGADTLLLKIILRMNPKEDDHIGASCKIIWNASHNPSRIEAMYLESIRRFSRQLSKIFRFTVRNISV